MEKDHRPLEIDINPKHIAIVAVVAAILFLGSQSFTTIDAREQGVVLRLGKYGGELLEPGLHFLIPLVDKVYPLETKVIHKVEFGYRSSEGAHTRIASRRGLEDESLRVTGDLNMGEVEWSVQYQINDPYLYLFNIRDPIETLRDLSESVICRVIGNRSVYEVLTVGRTEIEVEAAQSLQSWLDQYGVGIKVVTLKLQNVLPPDEVKPSYDKVNEAEQFREERINQAQEKYNAEVPRALGQAKQRLEQAEGYKVDRINRSRGDANKFISIYEEYRQAQEITEKRLYLETMDDIFKTMDIVLIDEDVKSFLPLMNLDKKLEAPNDNK